MRNFIINLLLTKSEKVALINALWRRSEDHSTDDLKGETLIKQECLKLAKELN